MRAIIIDDELNCRRIMELLLNKVCTDVEIITMCESGTEGIAAIQTHQPDLVFLDIEMQDMSGFDMLKKLPEPSFEVVFTTAYDQFALDAFKVNALDYLLKPIDEEDLIKAVEKVKSRLADNSPNKQITALLEQLQKSYGTTHQTITLPSQQGLDFIEVENIIYCQSDRNYTYVFIKDEKRKMISKTLKEIQAMLPEDQFFRVHHSFVINLHHIKKYVKTDGGYLIMSNGDVVKISRNKKDLLLSKF